MSSAVRMSLSKQLSFQWLDPSSSPGSQVPGLKPALDDFGSSATGDDCASIKRKDLRRLANYDMPRAGPDQWLAERCTQSSSRSGRQLSIAARAAAPTLVRITPAPTYFASSVSKSAEPAPASAPANARAATIPRVGFGPACTEPLNEPSPRCSWCTTKRVRPSERSTVTDSFSSSSTLQGSAQRIAPSG